MMDSNTRMEVQRVAAIVGPITAGKIAVGAVAEWRRARVLAAAQQHFLGHRTCGVEQGLEARAEMGAAVAIRLALRASAPAPGYRPSRPHLAKERLAARDHRFKRRWNLAHPRSP